MKTIIVVGAVLIALLLAVIAGKKNKVYADKFLLLYLSFALVRQGYLYIENTGWLQESTWMLLGKGFYLLNAPLFFIYVYTLTKQKLPSRLQIVLMFTAFGAYVIHFAYYNFWIFGYDSISIQNGLLYVNGEISISWLAFIILFLIIEPVFVVWFYFLLQSYKQRLLQSVSDLDRIYSSWLGMLFYLWLIMALVLVPLSTLSLSLGWFPIHIIGSVSELASVTFFFIVGYYGFKQTTIFTDLALKEDLEHPPKKNSYERSGLSAHQAKNLHAQLLALMEKDQPYLNGELTASELAQAMGISVNHLSQVLNQEQHQNFFDFVNGYRIKAVITKMENHQYQHYTLLALALDAGFNSKTSFNTVFKKFMHKTPSQYYRAIQSKD